MPNDKNLKNQNRFESLNRYKKIKLKEQIERMALRKNISQEDAAIVIETRTERMKSIKPAIKSLVVVAKHLWLK